jgi:hypothetical protein
MCCTAGVVDEDVNLFPLLDDRIDDFGRPCAISRVRLKSNCLPLIKFQFFDQTVGSLFVGVVRKGDFGTLFGQSMDNGPADSSTSASDECCLACQFHDSVLKAVV